MRVVFLAAGAGGMICGSCLRDNRLAASLIAEGKDVSLWPMYTPIRTDEPPVGSSKIHYGGLGVYLEQIVPLFRRRLGPIDRFLASSTMLRWLGSLSSRTIPESLGPLTVSVLAGPKGNQRKELERLVDDLQELSPDIVNLPNLMFLGVAKRLKASLGCKVVCTLSGEDIFLDRVPEPHRARAFSLIAESADDVDAFISVTDYFARHAQSHFRLPAERIHVVPMGIDVNAFSGTHRESNDPFVIGYFARICKEKGLAQLAEAFVRLRSTRKDVRLHVGGYLGRSDKPYFDEVMRILRQGGVADSVEYIPSPSWTDKVRFLEGVNTLCVPTRYPEAKGFYVLEALACGVPVVLPNHGSFPELVQRTGGGLLYQAGDSDDLQSKLVALMDDFEKRERLAKCGLEAVARLHSTAQMANLTWKLFEALHNGTATSTASP